MTLFDLLLYLFLFSAGFVSFLVGFYQIWRARQADAAGAPYAHNREGLAAAPDA